MRNAVKGLMLATLAPHFMHPDTAAAQQLQAQGPAAHMFLAALTPPPPVPPPPPDAPGFLTGPDPVLLSTGDRRVDAFRARIFEEAGSAWRPYLLRLFAGIRANHEIIAANQRGGVPRTTAEWVRRYVTPQQVSAGRRVYHELRHNPPPSPGGTPLEVQIAMWGLLSNYGTYLPRYDAIQTYLMLGAYNLGPAWTYYDFYKLAGLIITGKVERSKAKAFEDGRIGQVQLLPDEWDIWARDGDGDGKVDIWSNRSDIFASLGPIQWERGLPIMVEVERRPFEPTSAAEVRFLRGLKRGNVSVYMFRRPGGGAWPAEARTWSGRYVEPFGPSGPAFILTRNFTPVNYRNPAKPRYWPENEDPGFGVAVGLLADAIAGRPAPSRSTH